MSDRINNVPPSAPKMTTNRCLSSPFFHILCRLRNVQVHCDGKQAKTSRYLAVVILVEITRNHHVVFRPSIPRLRHRHSSSAMERYGRYIHHSASLSNVNPLTVRHQLLTQPFTDQESPSKDRDLEKTGTGLALQARFVRLLTR